MLALLKEQYIFPSAFLFLLGKTGLDDCNLQFILSAKDDDWHKYVPVAILSILLSEHRILRPKKAFFTNILLLDLIVCGHVERRQCLLGLSALGNTVGSGARHSPLSLPNALVE